MIERLAAIVRCGLLGHADPNAFGDCKRCGRDLLHLPPVERMTIAQRMLNEHMTEHLKYAMRERP